MIVFPTTLEAAVAALKVDGAVPRAGGTDLLARRGLPNAPRDAVDLRDVPGLDTIAPAADGWRIGARVRIATLAAHPELRGATPGLAQAAGDLATPQIRAVATVGGNLMQHVRCAWYRHPDVRCWLRGGQTCPARAAGDREGSCFDLGPCLAPAPSTLALAFLAWDAAVEIKGERAVRVEDLEVLYGDGKAGPHPTLPPGELVTAVRIARPTSLEGSAYVRTSARAHAEWPIIDVVVRLAVLDGKITLARVVLGGVAPIPWRSRVAEDALVGQTPADAVFAKAAARAAGDANPTAATAWKVAMIAPTIEDALARAREQA